MRSRGSIVAAAPTGVSGPYVYRLAERVGEYIHGSASARQISQDLHSISKELLEGQTLVLDFAEVELVGPVLIKEVLQGLTRRGTRSGRGIFRGRFIVAKDPNPEVRAILESFVREIQGSLLAVYAGSKESGGIRSEVLNLPPFLQETLKIVERHGPITSDEVAERLGPEKGPSARERLRQLFRRGLVVRHPSASIDGARFFEYEAFKPRLA